ncbi:MAG TPA: hypothetical protein VGY97_12765 [Solirubrobacteraceae bacterium]|jgi:hypothetical protein|nr:hypothetical protein [Solirubrobacteraceae bacterium]
MRRSRNSCARTGKAFARALVIAVTVVLLVPLTASAATYVLRPNNTTALQDGWTVTPSSSTADAVLNKPVAQPALPVITSYLTAGSGSAGNYAGVSLSDPPAFRTGETLKSTTAWAYASTAAYQTLTLSLWKWVWYSGYQQIASTTIPAGSPAGWYSATTQTSLDGFGLQNLSIGLQPSGTGVGSHAYAAYVDVETNDPAVSTPSAPTPTLTPPSVVSNPKPLVTASPLSPISLAAPVVKLAPRATSVPVVLSCAPGIPHGCSGELVLSLVAPAAKVNNAPAAHPRAVASRCARGCRVLGHTKFQILAGRHKTVKVHLAHSASSVFHGRHSVTIEATTITHDGAGHSQTANTRLTLTRSGSGAKPRARGPNHRGGGK